MMYEYIVTKKNNIPIQTLQIRDKRIFDVEVNSSWEIYKVEFDEVPAEDINKIVITLVRKEVCQDNQQYL